MRRAVLYARVSPASKSPMGTQLEALRGEVTRRGWVIVGQGSDHVHRTSDPRPGLRKAIKLLRGHGGTGDVLLAPSLATVVRGLADVVWLIRTLYVAQAELVTLDGDVTETGLQARFRWDAMASVLVPLDHALRSESARIAHIQASLRTRQAWGRAPVIVNPDELRTLKARGLSLRRLARKLDVSVSTVRRRLAALQAAAESGEEE